MEEKGSLGIFLLRDKAVAVWTYGDADGAVLHKLCIRPAEDEPATPALQAARAVQRQGYSFDEVFVAVDCSCYTQYNLHSEFNDIRQIESTIKFDAEEAAATDAMNLAVTFEITDMQQTGSQVTAYTADRQLLTDILLDLQEGGLDPTFMEPDVVCLARTLEQTAKLSDSPDSVFVVLSGNYCYMLHPNPGYAPVVRTLLVERGKDVTNTLIREVLLATAANQKSSFESVVLIGDTDAVDTALLNQRTGLEVLTQTPEKTLHTTQAPDMPAELLPVSDVLEDDMTAAELLIAYGAALAAHTRRHKADFRKDFMPYQGKRKVMEGSLRLIGISLTVLLLAVAIFFQLKAFNMKGYASRLEDKALSEYKAIMYGSSPPGDAMVTKLKSVLRNAEAEKIGAGDNKSVPAKWTYFLEAVNHCRDNVDINIQQISVTERSMKIKGDTNNRSATMALINEIKKHPQLAMGSYRYNIERNRDEFEITVEPKE